VTGTVLLQNIGMSVPLYQIWPIASMGTFSVITPLDSAPMDVLGSRITNITTSFTVQVAKWSNLNITLTGMSPTATIVITNSVATTPITSVVIRGVTQIQTLQIDFGISDSVNTLLVPDLITVGTLALYVRDVMPLRAFNPPLVLVCYLNILLSHYILALLEL
jgi:hypothetical protein